MFKFLKKESKEDHNKDLQIQSNQATKCAVTEDENDDFVHLAIKAKGRTAEENTAFQSLSTRIKKAKLEVKSFDDFLYVSSQILDNNRTREYWEDHFKKNPNGNYPNTKIRRPIKGYWFRFFTNSSGTLSAEFGALYKGSLLVSLLNFKTRAGWFLGRILPRKKA